jgi:YHS domain-containing protein
MKTSSKSLWAILFVGLSFTLSAQSIHTGFLSGVAISGYDTVAFYTQGQAVKGSAQFSTRYQGATWHFSSAENLALFQESPETYTPEFGGHCANGLSKGYKVGTNPENWLIYEDKLYLFYSAGGRNSWDPGDQAQISGQIESAWFHWERLK